MNGDQIVSAVCALLTDEHGDLPSAALKHAQPRCCRSLLTLRSTPSPMLPLLTPAVWVRCTDISATPKSMRSSSTTAATCGSNETEISATPVASVPR